MKRAPDGLGPVVSLDRRAALPIHRQIYEGYRQAILDGRVRPGQRLPSTRALAQDLAVSRIVVVTAFAQLVAEGYVASRVGAGTVVSAELPEPRPVRARAAQGATSGLAAKPVRPGPRRVNKSPLPPLDEPWNALRGPFRLSQPALDAFPLALWTRLAVRQVRRMPAQHMVYGDALGLPALREALAAHLRTFRSVACTADQILVVSGSQQALSLAFRALIAPGDAAWLEEPGYHGARDALLLAGARIVPVPVDDDGLDVDAGVRRAEGARAVYVTPSHQYPLGSAMSAARRVQLLDWARRAGAWIVEDDYDSEYRYDGHPLASLHGLDRDARVVYVGTFSKILFPGLRVGYLVVPPDLVPHFRRLRGATDIFPAPATQAVLAAFIAEGHFARHLRRMRTLYAERRRALVAAIEREVGDAGVRVVGGAAGMHLVALLPEGTDDHALALRAVRAGLSVAPLSDCYAEPRRAMPGVVLGFGSTRPREMTAAVKRLRDVMR
jgi:GntR family transcriptional regulator/MocR family aminotransferase